MEKPKHFIPGLKSAGGILVIRGIGGNSGLFVHYWNPRHPKEERVLFRARVRREGTMAKKGEAAAAAAEGSAVAEVGAPPPPPAPGLAVEELPKAVIRRIVKDKLSQLASAATSDGGGGEEMAVNKDALVAFAESARIFIHYLSAT